MLQLQDLVSVQQDWHYCFEIELVYLQSVYQHPTVQPTHYCALVDYFLLRLIDLVDSSQELRLLALLVILESRVVPRLNGLLKLLLDLWMVLRLLRYVMHRVELLLKRRGERLGFRADEEKRVISQHPIHVHHSTSSSHIRHLQPRQYS